MTQNQIRYLQLKEDERANLAKEGETNRANLENERLAREKWDYEKYGKSKLGQAIQAGKAVGGDLLGPVIRTIESAGTNPVTGDKITNPVAPTRDKSMISHTSGNAPGAFDYKSDVAKSKYSDMSAGDIFKEVSRNEVSKTEARQINNRLIELQSQGQLTPDQYRELKKQIRVKEEEEEEEEKR